MSRTTHRSKGPGYTYWASRWGKTLEDPGRWTKAQTHRAERRRAKDALRRDPESAAEYAAF